MSFVSKIRTAAAKRAAYRRTLAELRSMPLDVALDIDFARSDAKAVAYRAVYGA